MWCPPVLPGHKEMSMKSTVALVAALLLAAAPLHAQAPRGQMKGGIAYTLPSWFKSSFLNFPEDVEEARQQGKHVLVFLHIDECPYCARVLAENFTTGESRDFIRKHFDVVPVNIRSSVEAVWMDGKTYSERALAEHIKVRGTPTIALLDQDGNVALKVTGYRDPGTLRRALEYVQTKSYAKQSFSDYLAAQARPAVYQFRSHSQFVDRTDFKDFRQPLAIIFEDRQCADCGNFHEKTLNHPDVLAEMKQFTVVRLDAESSEPIIDLNGDSTTPARWAKALGLTYRPAVVLFNEGHRIVGIESRLYHFHFKETLRYVSGGYYRQYDSVSKYNAARRAELLGKGIDINYSE